MAKVNESANWDDVAGVLDAFGAVLAGLAAANPQLAAVLATAPNIVEALATTIGAIESDGEDSDRYDQIISSLAEVAGATTGAAVGLGVAGAVIAVLGVPVASVAAVVITAGFVLWASDIFGELFSDAAHVIYDFFSGAFGGVPPDGLPDSPPGFGDPLVLDLAGSGIDLSAIQSSSANFDFSGSGFAVRTGWIKEGSGLLVLDDGNSNGAVTRGELLGATSGNSFADLAALDSNGDGVINSADISFSKLKVWVDAGLDGVSASGELFSLADLGITSISLNKTNVGSTINGNRIVSTSTFIHHPPGGVATSGTVAEVVFATDRQITEFIPPIGFELNPEVMRLPELAGYGLLPDFRVAMSLNSDLLVAAKALIVAGESMSRDGFNSAFEALVYEWAGAADLDPASKGGYVDARHMAVIYAYYGIDPTIDPQFNQNPNWHNGPAVWEPLYQDILAQMQTRFIAQYSASKLLAGEAVDVVKGGVFFAFATLHLSPSTDRMTIDFDKIFKVLGDNEPANLIAAAEYWDLAISIVKNLRVEYSSNDEFVSSIGYGSVSGWMPSMLQIGLFDQLGIVRALGTSGADNIAGGNSSEFIAGGAGNDIVSGGGGHDSFVYWRGNGHDVISDNAVSHSNDRLVLKGLNPADVTLSRSGNDVIIVIAESTSGAGDGGSIKLVNSLYAYLERGVERVVFANGTIWTMNDVRSALLQQASTSGNDTITGFNVGDTIRGGAGNDAINGGDGSDTYIYARGDGHDVITDQAESYSSDKLVLEGLNPADVTLSRSGNDVTIVIAESAPGAGDGGSIKLVNSLHAYLERGVERVVFANGTIWTMNDVRSALLQQASTSGNDTITGFNVGDTIRGGAGNDAINGGDGSDTYIYARGDGHDVITDQAESYSSDKLVLEGLNPADVTLSRSGNDVTIVIAESAPGAGDGGSIKLVNSLHAYLERGVERVVFADGTIWTMNDVRAALLLQASTPGNDTITGFNVNDTIRGGAGDDAINGGAGSDTYIYARGDGHDVITDQAESYSSDKLVLEGLNPADVTLSRSGNDVTIVIAESAPGAGDGGSIKLVNSLHAYLERGVERVVFANGTIWTMNDVRSALLLQASTSGNDTITGFNVNDTIRGGAGNDAINGGAGSDTYIYARGDGHDVITDQAESYSSDKLVLEGLNPADVTLSRSGNDVTILIAESAPGAGDGGSIKLVNSLTGYLERGLEQVVFANGTIWTISYIRAQAALQGTSGNDTINGTSSNDTISGFAGNDTISAGAGDDVLIGGAGADSLNGGDGFDIASYETAAAAVHIHTGNPSSNTGDAAGDTAVGIEGLRGSTFGDELILLEDGITVWGGGGDDIITAAGIGATVYGEDGNDVVYGGAGASALYGGVGDDQIHGYGGADRIFLGDGDDYSVAGADGDLVDGGDGADTIHAGSGNDVLLGGAGTDQLHADDGDDTVEGGAGDDWLMGGTGNDVFIFKAASGGDGVGDFEVHGGTANGDIIELHGQSASTFAALMLNATEWAGTSYINLDGGHSITLHNVALSHLSAADFRFV